jgi:hypothetical protein
MKSSKPDKAPPTGLSAKGYVIWGVIIVGVAIVTLATLKGRTRQSTRTEPPQTVPSTNAPPVAAQASPDLQKLKGKWLRPDGGYIIEIKSVAGDGKLDAGYFNPRPIHIAKAKASQEGNTTKVFIELQDANYPGSTYTLTYIADRDLLAGVYFQALQGQSYEVYFERTR